MEILKDDVLGEIYLAKNNIEGLNELNRTSKYINYILGKNVILSYPTDKEDKTFTIINLDLYESDNIITKISVNQNTTDIKFITQKNNKGMLRLKANFDHLEKVWDVRSYVEKPKKPSYLQDSLNEILKLKDGYIEYTSYTNMIETVRNVFKESKNNKHLAKK